jgi:hypothetical protein
LQESEGDTEQSPLAKTEFRKNLLAKPIEPINAGGGKGGRISILLNFQDSFNRQKRMFNTMHLVHKDEGLQ